MNKYKQNLVKLFEKKAIAIEYDPNKDGIDTLNAFLTYVTGEDHYFEGTSKYYWMEGDADELPVGMTSILLKNVFMTKEDEDAWPREQAQVLFNKFSMVAPNPGDKENIKANAMLAAQLIADTWEEDDGVHFSATAQMWKKVKREILYNI